MVLGLPLEESDSGTWNTGWPAARMSDDPQNRPTCRCRKSCGWNTRPAKSGAWQAVREQQQVEECEHRPAMTCRIDRLPVAEDRVLLSISGRITGQLCRSASGLARTGKERSGHRSQGRPSRRRGKSISSRMLKTSKLSIVLAATLRGLRNS